MKYEISEIIDQSLNIYKKNFNLLFILSLASAVLGGVFSLFTAMVNTNDSMNIIAIFILALVLIYVTVRLQIMLILIIDHLIKKEEFSLAACFQQSSKHFWNYFFTMLGIIIIILLPLLAIALTLSMSTVLILKLSVGLILGIVILTILFFLNFAPLGSVLIPNAPSYFRTSTDLVKIQPLLVLSMLGLGLLIQIGLFFLTDLLTTNLRIGVIAIGQFIEILINAFIAPLFLIAYILLFKHLVSLQKSSQEAEVER